jgi:hypothetical protein
MLTPHTDVKPLIAQLDRELGAPLERCAQALVPEFERKLDNSRERIRFQETLQAALEAEPGVAPIATINDLFFAVDRLAQLDSLDRESLGSIDRVVATCTSELRAVTERLTASSEVATGRVLEAAAAAEGIASLSLLSALVRKADALMVSGDPTAAQPPLDRAIGLASKIVGPRHELVGFLMRERGNLST